MAIDPKKAQVAKIVCNQFTRTKRGSQRHPLIVAIRDGSLLDQMETQTLLRAEEDRTLYFPTLGTFALLPDSDPNFIVAKQATIQIVSSLRHHYEREGPRPNLSRNQLLEAVENRLGIVLPDIFDLGLYLMDFPGLGAVQGYARDTDHVGVKFVTVSERIMMIDDPESAWQVCVNRCRQNAELPATPSSSAVADPMALHPAPKRPESRQKPWLPKDWIFGKLIDEGGQGRTYKVRRNSDPEGDWFVFKRLKNANRADRFHSEIKACAP